MTTKARAAAEVEAGQAVYSPIVLAFYDLVVLRFSCRFVWQCTRREMLAHYDRHVGSRHLDIGVGTGWFLDNCNWPVARPAITLLDLNANSLRAAARRIARFEPRVVQADVLQPFTLADAQFDSVGLSFLLHCLPGAIEQKAAAVARHVAPHVARNGAVFGSTVLGRGVAHNRLGRTLMRVYNEKGIFSNRDDDREGLQRGLGGSFTEVEVEVRGTVALFAARP